MNYSYPYGIVLLIVIITIFHFILKTTTNNFINKNKDLIKCLIKESTLEALKEHDDINQNN